MPYVKRFDDLHIKSCPQCGEEWLRRYQVLKHFGRNRARKDGFQAVCKRCRKKKREEKKAGLKVELSS